MMILEEELVIWNVIHVDLDLVQRAHA